MSKVAVVFWSSSGNTETMAEAVLEGAKGAGADAEMINCADFNADMVVRFLRMGRWRMDEKLGRRCKRRWNYTGM